jgi:hypothetical protein
LDNRPVGAAPLNPVEVEANRLAPVLAGLRNPGQRSLEIAVSGPATAAEVDAAVRSELEKLIY